MGKVKVYAISETEIEGILTRAVKAGVDEYIKERQRETDRQINRNLHNTKRLFESYRTLKNDLIHSEYESDEAQQELRTMCIQDLMENVWDKRAASDDAIRKEIRRLQINAWRKRQIDRAVELLREDCMQSDNPAAMRKYRVLTAVYIQDDALTVQEAAVLEGVTDRTIHSDLREALKIVTPYIFSMEEIIQDV